MGSDIFARPIEQFQGIMPNLRIIRTPGET